MTKKEEILLRYESLKKELLLPEVFQDHVRYSKIAKNLSEIEPVAVLYSELYKLDEDVESLKAMLKEAGGDKEIIELTLQEIEDLNAKREKLKEDLKRLLNPNSQEDSKGIILEIRAGTGGEESALFASELYRMYVRFAENRDFRVTLLSFNESERGGVKEVIASIEGVGVYGLFKYETGVHRVQRIPETETNGRVHTSAVTVAVLVETEEEEIEINEADLRIDTFRSSGAGGQHVNTTDSAVRITHLPTGTVVSCQDERSQIKNRARAMKILRAKILDERKQKQKQAMSEERKEQVGTGDRSERIRTYNFPQSRVTDHRIGKTLHKLDRFMMGEIEEMVEALVESASRDG